MGEARQIARVEEAGHRPDRSKLDTAQQFPKVHACYPLNLAGVGMRPAFACPPRHIRILTNSASARLRSAKSIVIRMLTEIRRVRLMAKSSRVSARLDPKVGSGLRGGRHRGTVIAAVSEGEVG